MIKIPRARRSALACLGCLAAAAVLAQQAAPPPAAPAASAPSSSQAAPATLSSSLGVYVFPAKNQTPQTQSADEGGCYSWAKTQTNIDPVTLSQQGTPVQSAPAPNAGDGKAARGAVAGAATGAVVGAIAGDAGKGAAIGAGTGLVVGAGAKRRAQQQAAAQQQQQQQAAAAAQASLTQQKAAYNKAFSACMEGKGYTVK